jgi:hypothetical protein
VFKAIDLDIYLGKMALLQFDEDEEVIFKLIQVVIELVVILG